MVVKLRLQEVATQQGLNLSQVQSRSGLTMTMLRRYWYNQTNTVSLHALETLCALLHVSPGELLVREEQAHA